MDYDKEELYHRLNKTKKCDNYIPIVESTKDYYMILGNKIARSTRETFRRYESYLESKDNEIKESRFDKLSETVELAGEKRKGIWFDLQGFIDKLEDEDIDLIEESIKIFK